MQIRPKGNRLLLIRNEYSAAVKRGVSTQLGSISYETLEALDGDIKHELTEEEQKQLKAYVDQEKVRRYRMKIRDGVLGMPEALKRQAYDIDNSATGVDNYGDPDPLTAEQANAIWEGINNLMVALRKRGFKRPKVSGQDGAE